MAKDTSLEKLGTVIRKLAKAKYKSNVAFATACDVQEATIRRVIAGKQNVSFKILGNICEALDIKMSDLLKEIGK
jgi:DNA-binding Xre family transcriptional regulator